MTERRSLDNVGLDQIRARADTAKRHTEEVFVIAGDDLRSRLYGVESDIGDTLYLMATDIEALADEVERLGDERDKAREERDRLLLVKDEARDLLWCCKRCKKATTFVAGAVMYCSKCDGRTLWVPIAERLPSDARVVVAHGFHGYGLAQYHRHPHRIDLGDEPCWQWLNIRVRGSARAQGITHWSDLTLR